MLFFFFFISFIHLPFFLYASFCLSLSFIFFFISIYFSSFLFPLPSFFFFPFSSKFYSGHFTFSTFQLLTLPFHNLLIFSLKFSLYFFLFILQLYTYSTLFISFTFLTLSSLHAPTTCLITYILSISNSMPIVCYCFFLVTVDAPLVMGAFRWYKTSCRVHTASLPPAPGMVPLFCKMMEIRDLHR